MIFTSGANSRPAFLLKFSYKSFIIKLMQINVKADKLEITASIRTYIDEKLGILAKYIKRFDEAGTAQLWLEVARTTEHHHKGKVFRAVADLRLPKHSLRAEEEAEDLRAAIDVIERKLKMEIEKYKTRFVEPKKGGTK